MPRITLTLLTILIGSHIFSQNNAQWRGKNRDGIYHETKLLKKWPEKGPKLLWHFDELGAGHASAAVTSNRIFTAGTSGENGFVIALDHSGKQLWKRFYGKEWVESWDGVRSTPMVYAGKVYIMSGYGKVNCMNAQDGKINWTVDLVREYAAKNIKWGMTENLLIDGNILFCSPGGAEANVIALNKDTGKLIWKSKGNGELSAYCSPTLIKLAARKILVTHTQRHILGIDASDGKLLWKYEFTNKYSVHANTPLFQNGQLFCMSGYGKGCVMLKLSTDGLSIKKLWENHDFDNRMGGFVVINGKIYGSGDFSKLWYCLDWKTGKVLHSSTEFKKGNIIYADGMLYLYSETGQVALANVTGNSFNIISRFPVPYGSKQHWAHLVINNKKLYLRHGESLMVYDISETY